jgi:hypothetical protein
MPGPQARHPNTSPYEPTPVEPSNLSPGGGRDHGRARPGTARERLPRAALVHAQADAAAVDDLHVSRVDAPREARMALDQRTFARHRRALHIGHDLHGMGVAHGNCAEMHRPPARVKFVLIQFARARARHDTDRNQFWRKGGLTQVRFKLAVGAAPNTDGSHGTFQQNRSRVPLTIHEQVKRHAADAVATHFGCCYWGERVLWVANSAITYCRQGVRRQESKNHAKFRTRPRGPNSLICLMSLQKEECFCGSSIATVPWRSEIGGRRRF